MFIKKNVQKNCVGGRKVLVFNIILYIKALLMYQKKSFRKLSYYDHNI